MRQCESPVGTRKRMQMPTQARNAHACRTRTEYFYTNKKLQGVNVCIFKINIYNKSNDP